MCLTEFVEQLAQTVHPEIEVKREGEYWKAVTKTFVKNVETKFRLGEEFDELRPDDVICKSLFVQEGCNKWMQTQTSPDGVVTTIIREFNEKEMRTTAYCGPATSLRIYERIA